MKTNKKLIILLLIFNSSLIISSSSKKLPIKKPPISISLNDQLQQKIADSETANKKYLDVLEDLKLVENSLKVYKLEENGSKLEEDSSNEILFRAKLAALGKESLGDKTKTAEVKSFLKNLGSFSSDQKKAIYKYCTDQEFSLTSLNSAFSAEQIKNLELFRNFSPSNRAAEIKLSNSPKNDTKKDLLKAWQKVRR